MWRLRQKRVWIPAAIAAALVLTMVVLATIGHFANVPEDEQIQVRPSTSAAPTSEGPNDPEQIEDPVILPLPATKEPQELAPAVAQVVGSPDTARYQPEAYVATMASAAVELPSGVAGTEPQTSQDWAETILVTAWASDPWDERAKYKGTDTFTPQKVTQTDPAAFLSLYGDDKAGVRDYLTEHGLVVMEVEGLLTREVTDPADGQRKQKDLGTTTWTVAMLCDDGEDCKVFLATPGSLSANSDGGQ